MKTFLFTPEKKIIDLKGEKETFPKNLVSLPEFVMQIPSEYKNIFVLTCFLAKKEIRSAKQ